MSHSKAVTASRKGTDSSRLTSLDGIRGLSALHVVLTHFFAPLVVILPSLSSVQWFGTGHWLAAFPFFFLSGFIIMLTWNRKIAEMTGANYAWFLRERLMRLYPAYFAALMPFVAVKLISYLPGVHASYLPVHPWKSLPVELCMLQSIYSWGAFCWNGPAWSMSTLLVTSLFLFPVLFVLLQKVKKRGYLPGASGLMIVFAAFVHFHREWDWTSAQCRVVLAFVIGALVYGVWKRFPRPSQLFVNAVGVLCIVGYFSALYLGSKSAGPTGNMGTFANSVVMASVAAFILCAAWSDRYLFALLNLPPLRWLGKLSYSLYLSHSFVEQALRKVILQNKDAVLEVRLGLFALSWLLVIAAAAALYYGVEHPCEEWRKRRRLRRKAEAAAPPGEAAFTAAAES
ncbi:MAG: acyltransferase [Verrucomicrobiota bacterium]